MADDNDEANLLRPSATFLPSGTYDRHREAKALHKQVTVEDGVRVAGIYGAILKDPTLKTEPKRKRKVMMVSSAGETTRGRVSTPTEVGEIYCEVCRQVVPSMVGPEHHQHLTPHQMELTKELQKDEPTPVRLVNYHIKRDNIGFKMLEKGGWASQEGLGKESQGRKDPVPAVIKHDKLGVGVKKATTAMREVVGGKVPTEGKRGSQAATAAAAAAVTPPRLTKSQRTQLEVKERRWRQDMLRYMSES